MRFSDENTGHKYEARIRLEREVREYLDNGGVITPVNSNEQRYNKERDVKRGLFYSVHYPFHSKNTGISVARLKAIQRSPHSATDEELETLWVYFREQHIGGIWNV